MKSNPDKNIAQRVLRKAGAFGPQHKVDSLKPVEVRRKGAMRLLTAFAVAATLNPATNWVKANSDRVPIEQTLPGEDEPHQDFTFRRGGPMPWDVAKEIAEQRNEDPRAWSHSINKEAINEDGLILPGAVVHLPIDVDLSKLQPKG